MTADSGGIATEVQETMAGRKIQRPGFVSGAAEAARELMRESSKLRCNNCSGRMGLGIISAKVYMRDKWWWHACRFCSKRCRDEFFRNQAEEMNERPATTESDRDNPNHNRD